MKVSTDRDPRQIYLIICWGIWRCRFSHRVSRKPRWDYLWGRFRRRWVHCAPIPRRKRRNWRRRPRRRKRRNRCGRIRREEAEPKDDPRPWWNEESCEAQNDRICCRCWICDFGVGKWFGVRVRYGNRDKRYISCLELRNLVQQKGRETEVEEKERKEDWKVRYEIWTEMKMI